MPSTPVKPSGTIRNGRTRVIGARVPIEVFDLVDRAAQLRGKPRGWVVENGARKEAQRILEVAMETVSAHRRAARQRKGKK